jgi:dihydroorotate dehydrogenase (NAD+) catalytic subunit
MSVNLAVSLGGLDLQNPAMTASGTFGYGPEFENIVDLSRLGGIVCKTVTNTVRPGNAVPRIVECAGGMMNSIGLENKGVEGFTGKLLPEIRRFGDVTTLVISVAGKTEDDYPAVIRELAGEDCISAFELNISCPNVKEGGIEFGVVPAVTERLVRACVEASDKPVIAKLSPMVTSIEDMAKAAEQGGAPIVSLINTIPALALDWRTRKPILGGKFGGFSGPAIKNVALRLVYKVSQAVSVPIIGIGGISSAEDVLEMMVAGASAVQIGTANFIEPTITMKILDQLPGLLQAEGISDINDLIGTLDV